MMAPFYSIIAGLMVGGIYAFLFLNSFKMCLGEEGGSGFMQGLTFIARFIFIIVATLVFTFYFKVNVFWFLPSLGGMFWIYVLARLRIKQ
jgi:hypothetical protein